MIRVLIVEDQRLFREGIQALINDTEDIHVIAMAANGKEALEQIEKLQPDVVLMDIHMPALDGIQATAKIKQLHPTVKVILLTTAAEEDMVIRGVTVGADGFLLKELYPDTLRRTIREIYRGEVVLSGEVAYILATRIRELSLNKKQILAKRLENQGLLLTNRELDIAYLLMDGKSNKQISQKLFIGEGTVKNYISVLYHKFGTRNRNEAMTFLKSVLAIH
ncbi:response regulator transcription factor [Lentibacillus sp. N15]|uniref:response regulator transcription factor n=1 Tax=Lentibacillus songyuanensis TaxID=3136161 RepID=UPI0031BA20F7